MEFFRIVKVRTKEDEIQDKLTLENLEEFSTLMFPIEDLRGTVVPIGGIWGEFLLQRTEIKGGVRFALLDCPNALAWTLTTGYPPERKSLVIHMTINRTRKHPDFISEVNEFLDDHVSCLEKLMNKI